MSSLVEYDANTQLDPDVARTPGTAGESIQTNLLELAWRARWLILLMVLVGAGGAWVMLLRVEPRYTSVSRIYVERNLPSIFTMDTQFGHSTSYLYTQAELIRSTPVLAAAADAPENAQLETFREVDNRVAFLKEALQVEVGRDDEIINVWIELPSSEEAAQIVNSVVDAYITKYADERRTDTAEVLNILREEKSRRDAELEERIAALAEFRQQNAALAVQLGEENVITKRFAALAAELDRTVLELLDAKARHNRTKQMFETPSLHPFMLELASAQQQVAAEIRIESQRQLDLEKQLQELDLQVASLRATWGDGHPRVKILLDEQVKLGQRLADQEAAVEERKGAIISAYVETVAQEHQLLEKKREELQKSYDSQFQLAMKVNSQGQKLATLEEALERSVRLVDILDERIKEVNLSEDVGAMNVSIMEVAGPSLLPSFPQPAKFLALGVLLGGLSGFGLAWLRDLMDHRLRSIDEITATLQLPVLGALPMSDEESGRSLIGRVLLSQPRSGAAEAFRTLRTAIHFGLTKDEAKILAVTSPAPGDGKSTVASNLAIAMAQADQHVLLIDADMRKPRQHKIFGVETERGLSSVLSERCPVEELIVKTEVDTLDLLPCGSLPANPVELLNNSFFGELLEHLRAKYDKVIIDSPPVMPVADARVISAQTEATILVLRAERSTRRMSLSARDELWRVRAQRLGIVVNAVPSRKQAKYASGYGGYGYTYGRYGDEAYSEPKLSEEKRKKSRVLTAEPAQQ